MSEYLIVYNILLRIYSLQKLGLEMKSPDNRGPDRGSTVIDYMLSYNH